MWTRGTVVVIQHGDPEMAKAIVNGTGMVTRSEVMNMERDNYFMKKRQTEMYRRRIHQARRRYAIKEKKMPGWTKPFSDVWALFLYGVACVHEWIKGMTEDK